MTDEYNNQTPDINLAAYVIAHGHPIVKGERQGKKVFFCFNVPNADWQKHQTDFFGSKGKVVALDFVNALRALKSLVHIV